VSDAMPELDAAAFEEQTRCTRAILEQTHEQVLALVASLQLMQYEDVRDLVRTIDGQISALQGSLMALDTHRVSEADRAAAKHMGKVLDG